MAVLAGKDDNLDAVVDQVVSTRDRVVVERAGVPAAFVVSAREMEGIDYSIELLSEPKTVRRILEGEAALQSGNLYMGEELSALDPDARYVLRSVRGGLNLAPTARGGGSAWGLVASVPSRKALDELQIPRRRSGPRASSSGRFLSTRSRPGSSCTGSWPGAWRQESRQPSSSTAWTA